MVSELSDWVGQKLAGGRYQVLAQLGDGGMSHVYKALDNRLRRHVVIKAPRLALLEDPEFAKRFHREISSLLQLSHPHVVRALDVGEEGGIPFAVLEYLSGGSLRDRSAAISREWNRDTADLLSSWLADIAGALDFIHSRGYVHRDVKPDNILFDQHGQAYLSDFGIAKAVGHRRNGHQTRLTGSGMVLGTAPYMAPELLLGRPYNGRADLYALGVTLYELLSGSYPYRAPTVAALVIEQMTQTPPALDSLVRSIPACVAQAVHKAIEIEPEKRHPDCRSFAAEVLAEERRSVSPIVERGTPSPDACEVVAAPPRRVQCPSCGTKTTIPDEAVGKPLLCGSCNTVFFPRESGEPEPERNPSRGGPWPLPERAAPPGHLDFSVLPSPDPLADGDADGPAPGLIRKHRALLLAIGAVLLPLGILGALVALRSPDASEQALAPSPSRNTLADRIPFSRANTGFNRTNDGEPENATGHNSPDQRRRQHIIKIEVAATGRPSPGLGSISPHEGIADLRVLTAQSSRIDAVGFLPAGDAFVSAADKEVIRSDLVTGKVYDKISLDTETMRAAVFNPESALLVAATGHADVTDPRAGADGLCICDVLNRTVQLRTTPRDKGILSIALSPDGREVLYGCANGEATLCNIKTSLVIRRFKDAAPVQCTAVLSQGDRVLTASGSRIRVWSRTRAKHEAACELPGLRHLAAVPNSNRYLACNRQVVEVHELEGARDRLVTRFPESAEAVAASSDGRLLASASQNGVAVWIIQTGQPLCRLSAKLATTAVAFSPNGRSILLGTESGLLMLWEPPILGLLAQNSPAFQLAPGRNDLVFSRRFTGSYTFTAGAGRVLVKDGQRCLVVEINKRTYYFPTLQKGTVTLSVAANGTLTGTLRNSTMAGMANLRGFVDEQGQLNASSVSGQMTTSIRGVLTKTPVGELVGSLTEYVAGDQAVGTLDVRLTPGR